MAEGYKVGTSIRPIIALNPLAWLLWLLDFLLWLITVVGPIKWFKYLCRGPGSIQVDPQLRTRQLYETLAYQPSGSPSKTAYGLIADAMERFGPNFCMGTRTYLGQMPAEGRGPARTKFGETTWKTYSEVFTTALNFGSGLKRLGLVPVKEFTDIEKVSSGSTLLIYEDTCHEWMEALLGAWSQGFCVASSYATLGPAALIDAVNEVGATALVCNYKDVEKVKELGKHCPTLKTVIYTYRYVEAEKRVELPIEAGNLQLRSFESVVSDGASNPVAAHPPNPETTAVIMYTSGSTGKAKGVMLTQANVLAGIAGLHSHITNFVDDYGGTDNLYLAYLPLAHILEFTGELTCLSLGFTLGYSCPRTISSKGAVRVLPDGSVNTKPGYPNPPGGIQEFRPTVMAAVPKIWDSLKKGVESVIGESSALKRFMFEAAYHARCPALQQGRDTPLLAKIVFKKLKNMLGGRIKLAISGGGPLSGEVQNFIRTGFGIPLVQGYALTETCCGGTIQPTSDPRNLVVGIPMAQVAIRLVTCPDVLDRNGNPYKSDDVRHYGLPVAGRGEVCIRGASVMQGYFKQPEKTREAFTADQWFRTGDIGVWRTDGSLAIVDRLKNLVKLLGGEYIAVESMEKEYATCVYVNGVNGGVMCYGDGTMDRPVALIQANVAELQKWAKNAGVKATDEEQLCKDPATIALVLKDLQACGRRGDLGANEIIAGVHLISGNGPSTTGLVNSPWTPENGLLTASNKLNRKPIENVWESELAALKKTGIRG